MGWCSATFIFDKITGALLTDTPPDRKVILKAVAEALEEEDWDCQRESEYWSHPLVREVMREMHPTWFE